MPAGTTCDWARGLDDVFLSDATRTSARFSLDLSTAASTFLRVRGVVVVLKFSLPVSRISYYQLASFSSAIVDLYSSREATARGRISAQGPPSERRECKSRVTLLLRDADLGQIDHMTAEPTHGPHTTHAPAQAG